MLDACLQSMRISEHTFHHDRENGVCCSEAQQGLGCWQVGIPDELSGKREIGCLGSFAACGFIIRSG